MVPSKEINGLANALMRSEEFVYMKKCREDLDRNNMTNQFAEMFGNQANNFINSDMSIKQIAERINRLMYEGVSLSNSQEMKNYMDATTSYQKMFSECIRMLNQIMEDNMRKS